MFSRHLALVAASLLGAFSLAAQTVTFTPPVAKSPIASSQPPSVKWHGVVQYPDQLKQTSEIGYALIEIEQGADGTLIGFSTAVNFEPIRQVLTPQGDRLWTLTSAVVDGKPVITDACLGVLFNPKPRAGEGYDVPARLTSVSLITAPRRAGDPAHVVVRATLSVNEAGAVTDLSLEKGEDSYFKKSLKKGTATWTFSPATLAGSPVRSRVTMPIFVETESATAVAREPVVILPRTIRKVEPTYPRQMRVLRINGKVIVDFVVTAEGKVENAYVSMSSAPWFDEPALEAVRACTFYPGTVDGVPKAMPFRYSETFTINNMEGSDAFGVDGDHGKGTFNAQMQGVQALVYPYEDLAARVNGHATVRMFVTPEGKVAKVEVRDASAPEFGVALSAATVAFTFIPAFRDGKPIACAIDFRAEFSAAGMISVDTFGAYGLQKNHPDRIISPKLLDKPLKPISRRPPVAPPGLSAPEDVVIAFVIDEKGYAQIPHVVNGPVDLAAACAIQAVSVWQFEPPTLHGSPVMTKAMMPFHFDAARTSR